MVKGKYIRTEEIRKKISNSLKGRKVSESRRKRMSEIAKERHKNKSFGMYGKKLSKEHKQKLRKSQLGKKHKPMSEIGKINISIAQKGRIISKETRIKMSLSKSGKKNYNWKGGINRDKHSPKEPKQKKWKQSVFERDNWTCQNCGKRGCYLEAHHIKSWAKYPKLRYIVENGLTLCKKCHKLTSNYGGKKN